MKLNTYSIFDSASGAYMRPFFMLSDAQAVRSFTDIATDAEHEVGRHPEDYSLVRCGTFDDQTGILNPEYVEVIATALEVISASRNVPKAQMEAFRESSEVHKIRTALEDRTANNGEAEKGEL